MGSMCCVAASPNEPKTAGGIWSVVQNEPYWQTNASFSPPPSRWDFSLPSDDLPCDFHDGSLLHWSSMSSRCKESGLMTGNYLRNCSSVDHAGLILKIPNVSPVPQWTPSEIQEIHGNNNEAAAERGTKPFLTEPVHPLVFPAKPSETESTEISSSSDAPTVGSNSSGMDYMDVSNPFEPEILGRLSDGFKCGLCERLLSQKSPWSTRRIMRSGDMPVAGVLSCCHAFHVECLEQTTLKVHKTDPPCPICLCSEVGISPELRIFNAPNLRPSSRSCGFKMRKSGTYSLKLQNGNYVDLGTVRFSKTIAGPSMMR